MCRAHNLSELAHTTRHRVQHGSLLTFAYGCLRRVTAECMHNLCSMTCVVHPDAGTCNVRGATHMTTGM